MHALSSPPAIATPARPELAPVHVLARRVVRNEKAPVRGVQPDSPVLALHLVLSAAMFRAVAGKGAGR